MATLFKTLTESAQKVASTVQKAVEATGAAISDASVRIPDQGRPLNPA